MGSQRILTSVKLWVGVVLYLSSSFYHERQCIHKFQELGRGGLLETIFFLPTLLGFKKILWFSLAEFLQLIISSINILIAHIINLRHTFKKEEEEVVLSFFFFHYSRENHFHSWMNYPIDHSSDYLYIKIFLNP